MYFLALIFYVKLSHPVLRKLLINESKEEEELHEKCTQKPSANFYLTIDIYFLRK